MQMRYFRMGIRTAMLLAWMLVFAAALLAQGQLKLKSAPGLQ
jgi:hypothetical protein